MPELSESSSAFIPLAQYGPPAMPTQEVARRTFGKLLALIGRQDTKPIIADGELRKATLRRLDEVVAPPACGPLLDELDLTVTTWLADRAAPSHIKVVILPPCDDSHVVEIWGRRAGAQLLEAPARGELIAAAGPDLPPLSGEGLLVVPRLEDWFLRHGRGLRAVRQLLATLDATPRRIVVGCNSWAWAFLAKAAGADLLLPDPVTFRPFDQARLHAWFAELAEAEDTRGVRFRLPETGEDVLARDADGKPKSDYLETLAGRSLGIPWVAWHLWRRSLRTGDPGSAPAGAEAGRAASGPDEQTLWVAALEEYVLPGAGEQAALLVLHALLIHGPLTPEELRSVLPIVGESNIAPVLVKAGFLQRRGDRFACRAAAYPAMRDGLAAAGLPTGAI